MWIRRAFHDLFIQAHYRVVPSTGEESPCCMMQTADEILRLRPSASVQDDIVRGTRYCVIPSASNDDLSKSLIWVTDHMHDDARISLL